MKSFGMGGIAGDLPIASPGRKRATHRRGILGILTSVFLAMAAGVRAPAGWAESGRVDQLVGGNLRITFDTVWLPALGYRPIRVRVQPLTPVTAPRVLTLEVVVKSLDFNPFERVLSQPLELLATTTEAETILSLPPGTAGQCTFRVLEDGRPVPGLATRGLVPLNIEIDVAEVFPHVLVVSPSPPDFSQLATALRDGVDEGQMRSAWGQSGTISGTWTFAWQPRSQLPRRWIDYSSADLVCIGLDDLTALRAEDGDAFRALLDWTAAGGNLVVSGVGAQQQRLHVLESLLGTKRQEDSQRQGRPAWRPPDPKLWKERLPSERLFSDPRSQDAPVIAPFNSVEDLSAEGALDTGAPEGKTPPVITEPGGAAGPGPRPKRIARQPNTEDGLFWLRPYYWGMVVALGPEAAWPGTEVRWRWMLNALGPEHWLWDRRHGVSVIDANPEFWNFLIPGVGLAPVTAFEVLITLFVLAVGPVNYLLLRRAKRLHLMVITVPASAVVATGLLLAFGLASDGLSTRVRARSVTWLDQRQGRALCWARLSYYAGMAPRGGLRFPADTMVIPYLREPRIASDASPRRQLFEWDPQGQCLRSGWIASRTPTQFVTLRTRPTTLGLEVVSAGRSWEVRNRLGTRIHRLVLRDSQGDYFVAADIAPGGSGALVPGKGTVGLAEFLPPSLSAPMFTYPSWSTRRRMAYRSFGSVGSFTDPAWQAESQSRTFRAERRLARPVTGSSARAPDSDAPGLEPGSYVALVERSPEVELGTPAAREVAGFHLVLGRYADPAGESQFSGKTLGAEAASQPSADQRPSAPPRQPPE